MPIAIHLVVNHSLTLILKSRSLLTRKPRSFLCFLTGQLLRCLASQLDRLLLDYLWLQLVTVVWLVMSWRTTLTSRWTGSCAHWGWRAAEIQPAAIQDHDVWVLPWDLLKMTIASVLFVTKMHINLFKNVLECITVAETVLYRESTHSRIHEWEQKLSRQKLWNMGKGICCRVYAL